MKKLILIAVLIAMLFTFGCKKDDTQADVKEIVVGQTWVISSDDPLDGANGWSLTNHGISEYVYTLQPDGTLKSRFVKSIEAKDNNNFVAELNEGV